MTAPHVPGWHLLIDMYGARHLRDAAALEAALRGAAAAAGARVISAHFHAFGGQGGVTGVVLLAESHISVHTWPELDFAALDIFMCGDADAEAASLALRAALAPAEVRITREERGQRNQASQPSL